MKTLNKEKYMAPMTRVHEARIRIALLQGSGDTFNNGLGGVGNYEDGGDPFAW